MSSLFEVETQWVPLDYAEPSVFNEVYGFAGSQGRVHIEAVLMRPKGRASKTLLFFMHPTTSIDVLPVPRGLVAQGYHVLCARNRYLRNDTALIFEKVLLDFGAWVRYAREVLCYDKIVLVGWSGGGPLATFYQSQAELPSITATPAADPIDLAKAQLVAADGIIFQAASISRARILLDALDASVTDESNPDSRDLQFDLYGAIAPQPPYTQQFLSQYRDAQLARMRRVTSWVKQTLATLKSRKTNELERAFVVHRTMADPRYIDPAVDRNDRRPNWCLFGTPEVANSGPMGFARYSSLRSWLSQWSIDDSAADAEKCVRHIAVPFLAIENGADDGAPRSHMRAVFAAAASRDKQYHVIDGANHYYAAQPEHLAKANAITRAFLRAHNLEDL
jgi:pimeloyl-ACP methyl ester carboxylesterase